jgi:hypothetical protein
MTEGWRQRAEQYIGSDPQAWVAGLSDRNDLPLLRAGDLADEILSDAASVTIRKVSERRATFSRANVLAEVHRQFNGVRFASPDDRIAVAERTADLATGQSLLISAPELHYTPERLRRADGTSRFRAKAHEIYTTAILIDAEARLLAAGREMDGPAVGRDTVGAVTFANATGLEHPLSLDQALAVERIATSGRRLDVLVGPAGTGKSTAMAGLRAPSGSMSTVSNPNVWTGLPACVPRYGLPKTSGVGPLYSLSWPERSKRWPVGGFGRASW